MTNSRFFLVIFGIILLSVLLLSTTWEFWLEPLFGQMLISGYEQETNEDRLGFVVTNLAFATLALIGPFLWMRRITSRKNAEKALQESEARFRDVAEVAGDWIWELDENLRFTYFSPRFTEISGVSGDDLIGKTRQKSGLDMEDEGVRQNIEDLEAHRPFKNFEHSRVRPDGSVVHMSTSGKPIFDEDGAFKGYRGTGTDITSQKNALEALKDSEKQFRTFVDNLPIGVNMKDMEGRFLLVNKQLATWYGVAEKDLLGKTTAEALGEPETVQTTRLTQERKLLETGATVTREEEKHRANGLRQFVVINKFPVSDAQGNQIGFGTASTDITDRKRAEEALEESRQALRAVIDAVPAMVNAKDREFHYIFMNRYQAELYGISPENAVGKTASELVGAEYGAYTEAIDAEVVSTGQAKANFEEDWVDLKGVAHALLTNKVPLRGDTGDTVGIVTVSLDITERMKSEKALQKSEARWADVLNIAPEAVIAVDANMTIQLFNQGAERIFGYTSEEVSGQPLEILMPEYFRKHHRSLVEEFNRSGDTYRLMNRRNEILGLKKDGTEFPATASMSKLETGGEKIYTVMLQDITQRKQAEEDRERALVQAERANQAKSEFLASMSHELRTPLNAIQGFSEMLEGQYFGPLGSEKYQEYAADILTSSQYLSSLVDDILDLSVIEANKRDMVLEPLIVNNVIRDCSPFILHSARRKGIEYRTEAPDDMPFFFADRRAITQILVNLLSNAIKFTDEGGKVTLRVAATNRSTIFEINDTGRGIPEDRLPTLIDPFVRTETDPHLAQDGIGLGLTIVKSLVDLHDGELDIKSTVGKGTTVKVTLPSAHSD